MTSPPRKNRPPALTWLWKVTDHQVIGGLVVAAILALSGLIFATSGHDGGHGPPATSGGAPVNTAPANHTSAPATTPPATPAPPCPPSLPRGSAAGPVVTATGPPPWTVESYGFRYSVISVTRTTSTWIQTKPSITITGCVTRTEPNDGPSAMSYRISDQASSMVLAPIPLQGGGEGDAPVHQTSRLITVVWDVAPQATRLTIIVQNLYWGNSRNLVLRDVRVPSDS